MVVKEDFIKSNPRRISSELLTLRPSCFGPGFSCDRHLDHHQMTFRPDQMARGEAYRCANVILAPVPSNRIAVTP